MLKIEQSMYKDIPALLLTTAKLAVKNGTYGETLAQKQQYTVLSFGTLAQAADAVREGSADALLLDRWMAKELLKAADETLVLMDAKLATVGYSFVMAPGSDDVVNEINIAVSKLAVDGVLNSIFDAHGALYHSPY